MHEISELYQLKYKIQLSWYKVGNSLGIKIPLKWQKGKYKSFLSHLAMTSFLVLGVYKIAS